MGEPAAPVSLARWVSVRAVLVDTSYSSSTRLSVVLTDCPPGPEEREKRSVSSPAGIVRPPGSPGPEVTLRSVPGPPTSGHDRLRHSIAGHVSITIGRPVDVTRSKAASSMTPSWSQTPRAPMDTA